MVFLLLGVLSPAGALLAGAAVSPTGDRAKNFCCGGGGTAAARLQPAGAHHHGVGVRHGRPRCAAVSPTDRAKNFWVLCGRDGVPPAGSLELCKDILSAQRAGETEAMERAMVRLGDLPVAVEMAASADGGRRFALPAATAPDDDEPAAANAAAAHSAAPNAAYAAAAALRLHEHGCPEDGGPGVQR